MSELTQEYREWILEQAIEGCSLTETDKGNIVLEHDLVKGWVNFYDIDGTIIVELRLERVLDGEAAFFLHFELEGLVRAQNLFNEMVEVVDETTHREVRHVLLCCTCGVTTTFFANKLNELAQSFGIDYDFTAQPIESAKKNGEQYAAVLLAPQVGHQRKEVAEALPTFPSSSFRARSSGRMMLLQPCALWSMRSPVPAPHPRRSRFRSRVSTTRPSACLP